MKQTIEIFAIFLTAAFFASHANAAAIHNLGDVPQRLILYQYNASSEIIVAPNSVYRSIGSLHVSFQEREYRIDYDEEYALWPNGDFGPQRGTRNHNPGVSR